MKKLISFALSILMFASFFAIQHPLVLAEENEFVLKDNAEKVKINSGKTACGNSCNLNSTALNEIVNAKLGACGNVG